MSPADKNLRGVIRIFGPVVVVLVVVIAIAPVACTDPDAAAKAAINAGYTDVTATGFRWFGCNRRNNFVGGYGFSTGFEGKDSLGRPVSGAVCSGWLPVHPYLHLDQTGSPFNW